MSELAERIKKAISHNKTIWLNESDGSSYQVTASGNQVKFIDGKGGEFIEVIDNHSTTYYNLSMTKSIKIS